MPKVALVSISIVFTLVLLVFIADTLFNQRVSREVAELFKNYNESNKGIVSRSDLERLPRPVQKWLESSQVVGKERIQIARIKQSASMRTKQEKPWWPAVAEQYFRVQDPGFIWKVKVRPFPGLYFAGRDKYYDGKGNMLIKVLSLITVADGKGPEIDQGTMLRYLAETVWFPTAALSDYLKWEEIDAHSARATMTYGGVTASGVFTFNEKDEVTEFRAQRYGEFNGKYVMETWSVPMRDYKEFSGIRIPTKADVIWKLNGGDFKWYVLDITEVEYNKPFSY